MTMQVKLIAAATLVAAVTTAGTALAGNQLANVRANIAYAKHEIKTLQREIANPKTTALGRFVDRGNLKQAEQQLKQFEQQLKNPPPCDPSIDLAQAQANLMLARAGLANANTALGRYAAQGNVAEAQAEVNAAC